MSITAILGIGSPFGDDQVGWQVIKLLEKNTKIAEHTASNFLRIEYCDRPGTNLLTFMQGASKVILIDAVKTGAAIGTWQQFQLQEIEQIYNSISTHGIGVCYALKLGRTLQLLPKSIILYGVEIGDISYTKELSLVMQQTAMQLSNFLVTALLPLQQ